MSEFQKGFLEGFLAGGLFTLAMAFVMMRWLL